MRRPQIIGLAVAFSAGLGGVCPRGQGMVNQPPVEKRVEIRPSRPGGARCALTEIGLWSGRERGMLRWQAWPEDAVTDGHISRVSTPDAMNELSWFDRARVPLLASGEPVTGQEAGQAGSGGGSSPAITACTAGMRAVLDEERAKSTAAAQSHPAERPRRRHLDPAGPDRAGQEDYVSDMLFGNVRVLAVGQQIETKEGKKQADGSATSAALSSSRRARPSCSRLQTPWARSRSHCVPLPISLGPGGPESGEDLKASGDGRAVRVLRYGCRVACV